MRVLSATQWGSQLAALSDDPNALRWAATVPASYRERATPAQAAIDLRHLSALADVDDRGGDGASASGGGPDAAGGPGSGGRVLGGLHRLVIATDPAAAPGLLRLRRYGRNPVELSSLVAMLDSFGLVVVEAIPLVLPAVADGGDLLHVDDIGLRLGHPEAVEALTVGTGGYATLVEALDAAALGRTDTDPLNRLVIAAGLSWVQVRALRTYRRYRLQSGPGRAEVQLDEPLVAHPAVAAALVGYFEARCASGTATDPPGASQRHLVVEALDGVTRRDDDEVLRDYLALVDATVRTTYRLDADPVEPSTLAVKLRGAAVPGLGAHAPEWETFVHGSRVEGIHLRFGRVARGGIRWSDRPGDLRTEVLGLARAQVKKNAIIVPTGAKGGFVCRTPASGASDAPLATGASPGEVRAAYAAFVGALLDLTDDIVDDRVVAPPGVAALDGEDPYLVVAADRGTATFSDLANDLSSQRGFWLGDAFASGGSQGYDHKSMGITARGAWVAARRHFRQLGVDLQSEPVRVVGVGDMSGDVFGNGLLQSRSVRLVAAFDHRHVFLDPDPDPERSYDERLRLARLGRSSWDDYDRSLLSRGGGVWSRQAKSIPLDPAARGALATTADQLSPPAVISAILGAPVDLIWFGGIGTYIRDPDETDADVGDHADDDVRIVADQVRARVIVEGGNLAITNRARMRYSRRGGRVNADFIDNAAGVATSDREVNLKILCTLAIRRGRLAVAERDDLLRGATDEVATAVLALVDRSIGGLDRGLPDSARQLDAHEALLEHLESTGRVERAADALPSGEEWERRRSAGAGLVRPELAVLLSAAKSDLAAAIASSPLVDDPSLRPLVVAYFPAPWRVRFGDLVADHRLYPELLATSLAGEIVDRLGAVWAHETAAELGADLATVAAAYWTARVLLDADERWSEGERATVGLGATADDDVHRRIGNAVAALSRRYLIAGLLNPSATIAADGPFTTLLAEAGAGAAAGGTAVQQAGSRVLAGLQQLGLDPEVAGRVAVLDRLVRIADVAAVARASGRDAAEVVGALDAVAAAADAASLIGAIGAVTATDRWSTWQGAGVVDDASSWCTAAASAALSSDGVAPWLDARAPYLGRTRRLVAQMSGSGDRALTIGALAVRSLPAP